MSTKRSKAKGGVSRLMHQPNTSADRDQGFSGDGSKRRAGGKVPCRVLNDWAPVYGRREGNYRLVPVLHGLHYYDMMAPESVGTYDWARVG